MHVHLFKVIYRGKVQWDEHRLPPKKGEFCSKQHQDIVFVVVVVVFFVNLHIVPALVSVSGLFHFHIKDVVC